MLKRILRRNFGQVTDEELQFARQGMKAERQMKGLVLQRGERLDLFVLYILFHRRHMS